jgi:hypothetical protein
VNQFTELAELLIAGTVGFVPAVEPFVMMKIQLILS